MGLNRLILVSIECTDKNVQSQCGDCYKTSIPIKVELYYSPFGLSADFIFKVYLKLSLILGLFKTVTLENGLLIVSVQF